MYISDESAKKKKKKINSGQSVHNPKRLCHAVPCTCTQSLRKHFHNDITSTIRDKLQELYAVSAHFDYLKHCLRDNYNAIMSEELTSILWLQNYEVQDQVH